eukprot:scaffold1604_cov315-Prasinococcus_capsulatus_cf.AAC.4
MSRSRSMLPSSLRNFRGREEGRKPGKLSSSAGAPSGKDGKKVRGCHRPRAACASASARRGPSRGLATRRHTLALLQAWCLTPCWLPGLLACAHARVTTTTTTTTTTTMCAPILACRNWPGRALVVGWRRCWGAGGGPPPAAPDAEGEQLSLHAGPRLAPLRAGRRQPRPGGHPAHQPHRRRQEAPPREGRSTASCRKPAPPPRRSRRRRRRRCCCC